MNDSIAEIRQKLADAGLTDQGMLDAVLGTFERLRDENLALHRRLAGETMMADLGWRRAASKSAECVELRERMANPPEFEGINPSAPIPTTPEQAIAFIGDQFEAREDAEVLDRVRFQLTVHDLLSAFRWWFDVADQSTPSDGAIYEAVSRRTDPAGHAAADAEAQAMLGNWCAESVTVTEKEPAVHPDWQLVPKVATDSMRAAAGYAFGHKWRPTEAGKSQAIYGAMLAAAPSEPAPQIYTCIGKGGRYEKVGIAFGAGETRNQLVTVYRDTKDGELFFRNQRDFDNRMQLIEGKR